jgi:hypothetical protein
VEEILRPGRRAIACPPLPMYSWGEGRGEGHFLSLEEPLTLTLSPDYRGEGIR